MFTVMESWRIFVMVRYLEPTHSFQVIPLPYKLLLFMTNLNYAIFLELMSRNKLGIFLFTLGNLHPKYRSSLSY